MLNRDATQKLNTDKGMEHDVYQGTCIKTTTVLLHTIAARLQGATNAQSYINWQSPVNEASHNLWKVQASIGFLAHI